VPADERDEVARQRILGILDELCGKTAPAQV